jgi:hypothetical protein
MKFEKFAENQQLINNSKPATNTIELAASQTY